MLNRNLPPVDPSNFSMVPSGDVPRSTFATQHTVKTAFQCGLLIPFHIDEVLPGDVHKANITIFARVNTLLFPLMDNMTLETFFFFVPNRLVWSNWRKMMGERASPADSIAYTVPEIASPANGFAINTVYDYFGLPCVGQVGAGNTVEVSALPLRGYYLIWNEWFRDENLDNGLTVALGDGPDLYTAYVLQSRRKKHDYFTSCLPYPIKGGAETSLPLVGAANIRGLAIDQGRTPTGGNPPTSDQSGSIPATGWVGYYAANVANTLYVQAVGAGAGADPLIYADLTTATGIALNSLRLAVATQQFLERDSRSGTRYTELLRAHFGVTPEDSRLQRPEYIGGGRTRIETQAIPQTSATGLTGGTSPLGALGAQAVAADRHEYSYHATEHGFIIGLVHVTADITYQQGLHRMWTRSTRYDFYWPAFANLGEQAVRNEEIYAKGSANDVLTFGYQERWAEYRHRPSRITGLFKSTSAGNIDEWHAAQEFTSLPVLNSAFITDAPPISRVLAAGAAADNMQILFDSVFNIACTRAMPVYSVPGLDRF